MLIGLARLCADNKAKIAGECFMEGKQATLDKIKDICEGCGPAGDMLIPALVTLVEILQKQAPDSAIETAWKNLETALVRLTNALST